MLHNVLKAVVSVILGYLSAYLLDLAIARYERWKDDKDWKNTLEDLRQQLRTTS